MLRPSCAALPRAKSPVFHHRLVDDSAASLAFLSYFSSLAKTSKHSREESGTKARWWEGDGALIIPNKLSAKAVTRHAVAPKSVPKVVERMTVFQEFNRRPTDTLFLAHVPIKATIADLKKEFNKFGISRISLGRNKHGGSLGYAYVKFNTIGGAADALLEGKHHGFYLGRRFSIEPVDPSLPILARPTDLCLLNFTLRLPNPETVVSEVLKEYKCHIVFHSKVNVILGYKTGYLKFDTPEACSAAKDTIDKYGEQNPQDSVVAEFCYDEQETRRIKLTLEQRTWSRS